MLPAITFGLAETGLFIVNLVAALLILILGVIFGNLTGKIIKKILHELELNRVLKEAGLKISIEELTASFVKYIIYFIGIIWALSQLGLATTVLEILLIIILVILVIFIILAFKDFVPNITAGIYIHQKELFKKGDTIKVKHIQGKIIETNLIETKIKAKDGDIVIIPNAMITKSEIVKKIK
ncbi:MAG: mechanosensitive ion channel domain-containing protein [archaeon]